MKSNKDESKSVHSTLAESGRAWIESLGEAFIEDKFITNCREPNHLFDVARLEHSTRAQFPRILLDLQQIDQCPPIEQIQADLKHLTKVVSQNPREFLDLFKTLDDPETFRKKAKKLKLTEADFFEAEGGGIWFLVIAVAALVLVGCPDSSSGGKSKYCQSECPTAAGILCRKLDKHKSPVHRNTIGIGYEWK